MIGCLLLPAAGLLPPTSPPLGDAAAAAARPNPPLPPVGETASRGYSSATRSVPPRGPPARRRGARGCPRCGGTGPQGGGGRWRQRRGAAGAEEAADRSYRHQSYRRLCICWLTRSPLPPRREELLKAFLQQKPPSSSKYTHDLQRFSLGIFAYPSVSLLSLHLQPAS